MTRLILILILASSPVSAAVISGTAKEHGSGNPLVGMTVEAWTATGALAARVSSATGGVYQLTVPAGTYHLLAYDPLGAWATTFSPDAESFDTSELIALTSSQTVKRDLFLRRAGLIVGTVKSDNSPLAGATVGVYNESGTLRGSTRTDASGAYRLVVPAGTYKLAAWDDELNYLPRFAVDVVSFGSATLISVATSLEVRHDLNLPPASFLTGTVIDAVTRGPLAGMVTEAWTPAGSLVRWVITDHAGNYRIPLESGSWKLLFSDPAGTYAGAYHGGATSFAASPSIWLDTAETLGGLTGEMRRGGKLKGRLLDSATLAPVSGIKVGAWNADGSLRSRVVSDGAGQYVLVLPPGEYRVGVYDEALVYLTHFSVDSSSFAGATPWSVTEGVEREVADLLITRGGRFTGTVRNDSASAVAGASVAAYDTNGRLLVQTTTAADGTYRLLVPAGRYTLAAWNDRQPGVVATREASVSKDETIAEQDLVIEARAVRKRGVRPAGSDAGGVIEGSRSVADATTGSVPVRFNTDAGGVAERWTPRLHRNVCDASGVGFRGAPGPVVTLGDAPATFPDPSGVQLFTLHSSPFFLQGLPIADRARRCAPSTTTFRSPRRWYSRSSSAHVAIEQPYRMTSSCSTAGQSSLLKFQLRTW